MCIDSPHRSSASVLPMPVRAVPAVADSGPESTTAGTALSLLESLATVATVARRLDALAARVEQEIRDQDSTSASTPVASHETPSVAGSEVCDKHRRDFLVVLAAQLGALHADLDEVVDRSAGAATRRGGR